MVTDKCQSLRASLNANKMVIRMTIERKEEDVTLAWDSILAIPIRTKNH